MKRKLIVGQSVIVFSAFSQPKTMLQVARETGIERANICWKVKDLRDEGRIYVIKRGLCPVSGARATFLCTDPNLTVENSESNQIKAAATRPEKEGDR